MRWTSMELAALATAAVPGLSPTGVAAVADDARDFTSAIVIDAEGNRWRVRSPQHQEAAMRLETELQVLRGFSTAIRAELPFRVPSVAGAVRRGEMRTFIYNHLPGDTLELEELAVSGPEVIDDVGRTIAAIHDLDEMVVDYADLPRYSAERFRQRRLNELDQAATTGQIPSSLLRRWEHAMEEKALWDFVPTVGHGDLHEDSLLVDGQRVVAVTGWTDLHIGDPADDFAWLAAAPDPEFAEAVLTSYQAHRRGPSDEHLMRRAALTAEFALAQWLVRGHATENQEMVDEARTLLGQLEEDINANGGQPIALTPMQGEDSADTQDSRPVVRAGAAATVADTGEWADSGADDQEPAVITDATADDSSQDDASRDSGEGFGEDPVEGSGEAAPSEAGVEPPAAPAEPVLDDEAPTGQFPAVSPEEADSPDLSVPATASAASPADADSPSAGFGAADEPLTGAIPAVMDDAHFFEEDDTPTGKFSPVQEEPEDDAGHPVSGPLPIVPDAESEKRAKQKNFFPAPSSDSAQSASSPYSGSNPAVPSAEDGGRRGDVEDADDEYRSADGDVAAPETPGQSQAPSPDGASSGATDPTDSAASGAGEETPSSGSSTRGTVYSTYPGLRPPGS